MACRQYGLLSCVTYCVTCILLLVLQVCCYGVSPIWAAELCHVLCYVYPPLGFAGVLLWYVANTGC